MPRKYIIPQRRKKSSKIRRRKKKLALKAHNFVERVEDTIILNESTLNASGNLTTNYSKNFQLADIPQVNHYQNLFDDYVLNKVVAEIRYDYTIMWTDTTYHQSPNPIYPMLLIRTDHNDAATGYTWADLKQSERSRLVQLKPGRKISHVLKPAVSIQTYKTATTEGYAPKWNQQLRTVDDTVPHYGLQIQVQTQPGSPNIQLGKINIMYKYYFTMKNTE